MTLYISNPSRQPVVFYYRLQITKDKNQRDTAGASVAHIPPGGQIELTRGMPWTQDERNYVIAQILRAGGASAAEAHGKLRGFTGLLFREGHPVDVEEILTAHDAVLEAAQVRSVTQVETSAKSFDMAANRDAGRRGRGQRIAKVTEVEIVQELPPHQYPTGNEVTFKQTIAPPELLHSA